MRLPDLETEDYTSPIKLQNSSVGKYKYLSSGVKLISFS